MASVSLWTGTAPYLKATINWGNGTAVDIEQSSTTIIQNNVPTTAYNAAYAVNPGLIANTDGFITNLTTVGQTFNGYNQNLNVKVLGIGGIKSFDVDLTGLNSLTSLALGGYYTTPITTNALTFIPDNINISSFTTILPLTSANHTLSFQNNQVDCTNFNPTWNNKSSVFNFQSNNQTTPLLITGSHRLQKITIQNNTQLQSLTLNNLQYITDVCILNNNGLSLVSINGLNLNATTDGLTINLVNNNFITFNPSWISSFPAATKQISINLSANRIVDFDCLFNGANMGGLNLSAQIPAPNTLQTISDNCITNSTFKQFDFRSNKLPQCPIFPTTTTHITLDNTQLVATGGNPGDLIRPNLSPNMVLFSLNGSTNLANLSQWRPNQTSTPENKHTPLQNITTWTEFSITSQGLTSWVHQFSTNISSSSSYINLESNSLSTIDMSLIGGFASVKLRFQGAGNTLTTITNLTNVTKTRILDISVNTKLTSSSSIIPNGSPWPASLYNIDLSRCTGLLSWTKSFAGFNLNNFGNLNINFNGSGLDQTSVNYIINDLIKNTNLTNGTINFSALAPTLTYTYPNLILSSVTPDTLACLNCLTTPVTTPCNPTLTSGSNLTGMGRGFTVRLIQV
jgi:hypothetical protein